MPPQTDDFLQFLRFHAECDEPNVGDPLFDALGSSPDFSDGIGNNVGPATGIIGGAREMRTSGAPGGGPQDFFQRTVGINGAFDLTSQKRLLSTFNVWVFSTDDTVGCSVFAQIGPNEQEKAWLLRNVHQHGGGVTSAFVAFRDNAGGDYDWSFAMPTGGFAPGGYPLNEWCMIGWSANITADRTSGWLYSQTAGQHYVSFTGASAFGAPFNYTTRHVSYIGDNQQIGGSATGGVGPRGDIDQMDMFHDIEFQQADVDYFWNNGNGRIYPSGYLVTAEAVVETGAAQWYWGGRQRRSARGLILP